MSSKNFHRAFATIATDPSVKIDHAFSMAVIWKLMGSNRDWHKQQMKPFTWNMEDQGDGVYGLMFSSICPSDTRRFVERLKEGLFRMKDGTVFRTVFVTYIPDASLDTPAVQIDAKRCQCFRKVTHKRVWQAVLADKEPAAFEEKIIKGLRHRAESFLVGDEKKALEKPIRIVALGKPSTGVTQYKGSRILTQSVSFLLEAPREIQKVAVYGGIGREPSSGFGFVVPQ